MQEHSLPLNIFEICRNIENIEIQGVPFKTKELRGMVSIAADETEKSVILVNSNKSIEEQNYHGAHEFMHIFTAPDEKGTILQCYENIKPNQDIYIEWLANEGAAEFFIPYKTLLPMIKIDYDILTKGSGTYEFCEAKSKTFGVTPVVLQNRINALAYEIEQYVINDVDIDEIKILSLRKQHEQGIYAKSLNTLEIERLSKSFQIYINSKAFA